MGEGEEDKLLEACGALGVGTKAVKGGLVVEGEEVFKGVLPKSNKGFAHDGWPSDAG